MRFDEFLDVFEVENFDVIKLKCVKIKESNVFFIKEGKWIFKVIDSIFY